MLEVRKCHTASWPLTSRGAPSCWIRSPPRSSCRRRVRISFAWNSATDSCIKGIMRSRPRILLWVLCLVTLSTATFADSRDVVRDVATLIDNNYFDAAKAGAVARDLRSAVRSGAFDHYREPRDLAVALTTQLKTVDQHFNVVWLQAPSESRTLSALDSENRSPS